MFTNFENMNQNPHIRFLYQTHITLKGTKKLRAFIFNLFIKEGQKLQSLNYIFCTDKFLLKINKKYLNHDFFTDTITFKLSEDSNGIEGEVYISVNRVKENARSLRIPFRLELLRVILHGALHLCGFEDKTAQQKQAMKKKEDSYIFSYPRFHVKP